MNRPKYPKPSKDLSFEEFMCAESKYFKDIEKYCDELEKQIEDGYPQHLAELCDIKDKKISKLEKALDSTISLLANELGACAYPAKEDCGYNSCAKCWKEYLLKDEL